MSETLRRDFLSWVAASPFFLPELLSALEEASASALASPGDATRTRAFEALAHSTLDREIHDFIAGGSDDETTVRANREAYQRVQILARRLVDVSRIDTSVEILGERMETPILIAPIGTQGAMHPDGELATARASTALGHTMIASTVSTYSIAEIRDAAERPVWFQLYPTPDLAVTENLLRQAEDAGCGVCALTVDTPVLGNRESQAGFLSKLLSSGELRLGNFDDIGLPSEGVSNPAHTWDFADWLRANTKMKLVIKGVVTAEDAALCVEHGMDGLIISNHGGRQLDSGRGTLEALPEISEAVDGRMPVLIDGGIHRGTDIFKALALGADAICIGRAYAWGLATFGQAGVERVLEILRAELIRDMQLAGTPTLAAIDGRTVRSTL